MHGAPPDVEGARSRRHDHGEQVTKGYGGRTLFREVDVTFSAGNNYGLTGPNGAGKSTFMKLLLKQEDSDEGHVSLPRRVGWLRQEQGAFDDV